MVAVNFFMILPKRDKFLIWAFFITLPATGVDLGGIALLKLWILVGALILLSMLVTTVVSGKLKTFKMDYGILSIALFIFLCLFSIIFLYNEKSINYFLAYVTVLFVSIFLIRAFLNSPERIRCALDANSVAVLLISIYVIIDFILISSGISSPSIMLGILDRGTATSNFLGMRVFRAYGLSDEPNVLAYFFSTLGLLGLWWRIRKGKNFYFYIIFFCIALVLTFAATIAFAFIASMLTCMIIVGIPIVLRKMNSLKVKKKKVRPLLLSIFSLMLLFYIFSESTVYRKLSNPSTSRSGVDRIDRMMVGIENAQTSGLFGNGLGWTTLESGFNGSYLNWYLTLISDVGWIGLLLILFYLIHSVVVVFKNYTSFGLLPLFAALSGVYYLALFASFYEPFIFIFFSLLVSFSRNKNSSYSAPTIRSKIPSSRDL